VQDSIFVEEQGTVNRLFLELDIDHSYVGDLVVYIEHNGEYLVLQDQAGGNAQGLKRQFDISAFAGRERAGEWTLVIEDRAQQDVGRLNSWALSFED
jgi:subtilisin-like proprotein convertase family protein